MPRGSDARLSGETPDDNPLDLTPTDAPPKKRRHVADIQDNSPLRPMSKVAGRKHRPIVDGCRSVDKYEKLNKIDEGAYGVVWRAQSKDTGQIVALKQIKLEKHPDGFPKSSLREITVLQLLQHQNIVEALEMVVGKSQNDVFMVMEYMEHELKTLLWDMAEGKRAYFSLSEVKSLMHQLMSAVHYMHDRNIFHRDLKSSNILFDNTGTLKVCDFGLARKFGDPIPRDYLSHRVAPYTGLVVTLWYRSPELILGFKPPEPNVPPYELVYDGGVDVWSCGCIFGELLLLKPLFYGQNNEVEHLAAIFDLTGTPTEQTWPEAMRMPIWPSFQRSAGYTKKSRAKWREKFGVGQGGAAVARGVTLSEHGLSLMQQLLSCNPENRMTAKDAVDHAWFQEAPAKAIHMPKWADSNCEAHEARRRIKSDERYQPGNEGASMGVCVNPRKFLEEMETAKAEAGQAAEVGKKLPQGWMERKSSSTGKVFYINLKTKETQWHKPTGPAT